MKFPGWIIIFVIIWASAFAEASSSCVPKNNRKLVIGHSYDLNWWMRNRLHTSALVLGYELEFFDLRSALSIEDALLKVDAVVVPGGADIHPRLYSAEPTFYVSTPEGPARDEFELNTFQTYLSDSSFEKLPLLGICRGMQMMAVAQGVPLVQDLKAELGIKNRTYRFDQVDVPKTQSVMSELFPEGKALGFKIHHQNPKLSALSKLREKVRVTATSMDQKIVEAIELVQRPAIGVQFHPEQSFPTVKHSIFRWLLEGACEKTHRESL